jgi:hypothetical protein
MTYQKSLLSPSFKIISNRILYIPVMTFFVVGHLTSCFQFTMFYCYTLANFIASINMYLTWNQLSDSSFYFTSFYF